LPPPSPPLFPYTTLFRSKLYPFISPPTSSSHRLGLQHATYIRRAHRRQLGIAGLASLECRQVRGLGENQQLVQRVYTQARDQIQDRKSTRLNSSHGSISY